MLDTMDKSDECFDMMILFCRQTKERNKQSSQQIHRSGYS